MQSGEVAGGEGLGWLQSGAGGGSVRVCWNENYRIP